MWTRLEVFQCLDSRFCGNDKQSGNDERDTFPWFPYGTSEQIPFAMV